MKRTLMTVAVLGLLLGVTAPSLATDSKVFNCEKAVVTQLASMSRARGKCITKCVTKKQTKPGDFSCSPPFDSPGAGTTQDCADKTVEKYGLQITNKCTGYMPDCGGFRQGWCGDSPTTVCDNDQQCSIGYGCKNRCSVTTTQLCDDDTPCPSGESCVSGAAKTIPGFIEGNLYDGFPFGVLGKIDEVAERFFQCRQSACTVSGDLCSEDGDCAGGADVCRPGKCSDGTPCSYDGQCLAPTTKKCIPLGRCSGENKGCTSDTDCSGTAPCLRRGRCNGTGNDPLLNYCITPADCPNTGGTCVRTLIDTDRKAEMKCTQAVGGALAKMTYAISNCQTKCALERDVKLGQRCQVDTSIKCKVAGDCPSGACRATSCDPFADGRCSITQSQVCKGPFNSDCPAGETCVVATGGLNDPIPISKALKDCRDKAIGKATDAINKKCLSLPICGAYGPFGGVPSSLTTTLKLTGFVNENQDGQFKDDNPDKSPSSNFCQP